MQNRSRFNFSISQILTNSYFHAIDFLHFERCYSIQNLMLNPMVTFVFRFDKIQTCSPNRSRFTYCITQILTNSMRALLVVLGKLARLGAWGTYRQFFFFEKNNLSQNPYYIASWLSIEKGFTQFGQHLTLFYLELFSFQLFPAYF